MSRRLDRGAGLVRLVLLAAIVISAVLGWLDEPEAPRPGPVAPAPRAVPAPPPPQTAPRTVPRTVPPAARRPDTSRPGGATLVDAAVPLPAIRGRTRFEKGTREAGRIYTGTAFATAHDGVWATARHVADGCGQIEIRHGGGGFRVARAVHFEATDLSLLVGPTGGAISAARDGFLPLGQAGLDGFAMGYPDAREASVHLGYLARIAAGRPDSRGRERWATAGLWQIRNTGLFAEPNLAGISGGPLFDRSGGLLGIVVGGQPRRARATTIDPVNLAAFMAAAGAAPDRPGWRHRGIAPDNADAVRRTLVERGMLALVVCRT